MTQQSCVQIRLVLTIEIPYFRTIRIDRTVPIVLGRTVSGVSNGDSILYPGIQGGGEVEVDLSFSAIDPLAPQCSRLSLGITRLGLNGILKLSETDVPLLPKSQAYTQLELIQEAYRSENSDF
jgi:hypothetical protein